MTAPGMEITLSLGTAVVAGLLIGAERQQDGRAVRFAGARTFTLIALLGAIGMLIDPWIAFSLGLVLGALIAIAYYRDSVTRSETGVTTEIAALVTFALGGLCTTQGLPIPYTDRLLLVAAGSSATLALLSLKKPLHGFLASVSEDDVYAVMKLLLLAVILLPLLPDNDMGPWGALNPRHIGVLAVLISSISFAGYIAIRVMGPRRGLGMTGLLGGLASSTAVTLSFSSTARKKPQLVMACTAAIVLACSTMFPRMIVDLSVTSPELVPSLVWFLGTGCALSLATGVFVFWRAMSLKTDSISETTELEVSNPFSLSMAMKFAFLLTVILVLSQAAADWMPETGAYWSAILGAMANVDAITLSLGKLHHQGLLTTAMAQDTILLVVCSSFASKIALASWLGGTQLGVRVSAALAPVVLAAFVFWLR